MSPQQSKEDLISSGRVIILGGFDLTEAASQRPGQSRHRLYKPTHCPPSDCYIIAKIKIKRELMNWPCQWLWLWQCPDRFIRPVMGR